MKIPQGLGVALITPFNNQLKVDFKALEKVLKHLYHSKAVDYIVALGSTGEASTLTVEESQAILSFIRDFNDNRLPLVFGHSKNDTNELIQSLKNIDYTGFSAILTSSPGYVKPTQKGIIAHFQQFADRSPLPIILYNIPSRTGSKMSTETIITLAKHDNIIGVKESSEDIVQAMAIRANVDEDFLLISGDDMLTVPLCSVGGNGLISVLGNAYPTLYKNTLKACFKGDYKEASRIASGTIELNQLMYQEGNPAGVKQLLAIMGLCKPYTRLPLLRASATLAEKIKATLL